MVRLGRIAVGAATAAVMAACAAAPASAAISLVSVPLSGAGALERLEATGLDVTHDVSPTNAKVLLYDADDRATLASAGFEWRAVIGDLRARSASQRAREESVAVPTALPSGRSTYRVYEDYVNEINGLAEANPEFVRKVTVGQTFEGREIIGLEIATDVNRTDDGRPAYFQFGLHHAREWPSGEFAIEFAIDLVQRFNAGQQRTVDLLNAVRVFIVPVVNVDGFIVSRGAALSGSGGAGTYPSLVAGMAEYKRKNCRPTNEAQAAMPCAQRPPNSGIDLNRNYGYYWGGAGAGTSPTAENYRGSGPFSEPESQAVHELSSGLHPTVVISNHTFTEQGWWLRQPGFRDPDLFGPDNLTPDEPAMKALGDAMGDEGTDNPALGATGWPSDPGWELGDITGATEDWNYFAQGAYGYTPEARGLDFHGAYQTMVVQEYEGDPAHPDEGVREASFLSAETAADPAHHGVLQGAAPAGATLTLSKQFASPICQGGVSGNACQNPTPTISEALRTTLTVPAGGSYEWHVNPSSRPLHSGEEWTMSCRRPGSDQEFSRQVDVARGEVVTEDWAGSTCGAPPPDPNQPPLADFDFLPSAPAVNEAITFTSTSDDPDGAIATTNWDLDDDGQFDDASGLVVTHSFSSAGPHDVSVEVTDDDGDADSETKTVTVAAAPPPNQPPQADFSFRPENPEVGENVVFRSSSSDPDGTITSQAWDLDGDGQFDDGLGSEVSRAYGDEGRFRVGLRVTDDDGASANAHLMLVVGDPPPFCRGRSATIIGSGGDNRLRGTARRDVIVAMAGDDMVRGRGGRDLICGRRGGDLLRGGKGRDLLIGGRGGDRLRGGPGADLLLGNKGLDALFGGRGGDRCRGGNGRDRTKGC